MRRSVFLVLASVALAMSATPAAAQDEKRIGLLFAYPGAVGVQWDVTDRFGLRVDGDYERHNTTFTTDYSLVLPPPGTPIPPDRTTSRTSHFASIGVSPMFIIGGPNPLTMYVGPRVGVGIQHGPGSGIIALFAVGSVVSPPETPPSQTDYVLDAGVTAGASYRLSDRFAIFGEGGVRYDRTVRSRDSPESKSHSIGLRAGIGGILYF